MSRRQVSELEVPDEEVREVWVVVYAGSRRRVAGVFSSKLRALEFSLKEPRPTWLDVAPVALPKR